jgi:hypothetical protein
VLATLPEYFAVLIQAGNSARFMDDEETAAAYYAEAGRVRSDSWVPPYNLACLRAVNGQPEPALTLLADAADRGFASTALLQKNEDFDGLRGRLGWSALMARVQGAAAQARADRAGQSPAAVR